MHVQGGVFRAGRGRLLRAASRLGFRGWHSCDCCSFDCDLRFPRVPGGPVVLDTWGGKEEVV